MTILSYLCSFKSSIYNEYLSFLKAFQSMEHVHLDSILSNSVHIVQTTNTVTGYRNVVMFLAMVKDAKFQENTRNQVPATQTMN